jgi:quercetin dioxygenase-like cupin family protein
MIYSEVEKDKVHTTLEFVEYVSDSVATKSILTRATGNVIAFSFDTGEVMTESTIPFDTFIQIIDGKAEIIIDGKSNFLNTGQSIVIPAHYSSILKANNRFKMISTIIKSGYEM